ncbi:uncharacterized protein J7T54_005706 [Emericellopsis cladophorae]|uniref:Uncharacterized protein n=1 Tax=Emericellopsis cladophorae TaxID=2686198 RepID=A0A9Q0BF74_9HYPO|nr:uncharacterized protein J7T54_005706 [Emericellopsis cladophorae]KAI6783677.1 hypothetical protein J7T54_005706 [Emericellopsis cladophorae]
MCGSRSKKSKQKREMAQMRAKQRYYNARPVYASDYYRKQQYRHHYGSSKKHKKYKAYGEMGNFADEDVSCWACSDGGAGGDGGGGGGDGGGGGGGV